MAIKELSKNTELVSYKTRFNKEQALMALSSTGLHESAWNLLWIDPYYPTREADKVIAGPAADWDTLDHAANTAFIAEEFCNDLLSSSELGSSKFGVRERILFPGRLPVHAPTLDSVKADWFPGTMRLLTNHINLQSWYHCETVNEMT